MQKKYKIPFKCLVHGCYRQSEHLSPSLCKSHAQRVRRSGSVGASTAERKVIKTCTVQGCENPHSGKGLCNMHSRRMKRNGTLEYVGHDTSIIDDFLTKIKLKTNKCIEWERGANKLGYGTITYKKQRYPVHRLAKIITDGLDRADVIGLEACHHCDNPKCYNPEHIFWGTHGDNMRDMAAKGRYKKKRPNMPSGKDRKPTSYRGSANKLSKLNEEKVKEILNSPELPLADIADKYDVHVDTIRLIRKGKTWSHVTV